MRILHLSHGGLPDLRVERTAQTAKKKGYATCFAGSFIKGAGLPVKSFDRFYRLPFNKFANAKVPSYWGVLKKRLCQILKEYRPDLVHAHNIVAARLTSEFSVPFVYDDHEYWSKRCRNEARIWKPNKMYIKWLWTKWEKKVLHKASATVTVSKTIAEEHAKYGSQIYVVQNFPSYIETASLRLGLNKDKHLSSVYVGRDCSHPSRVPYRNVEGLIGMFRDNNVGRLTVIGDSNLPPSRNVDSVGFLPHQEMMRELTRYDIGLLPWKKHWFHEYCNPNKPYEYAHAGLLVLTVSDFPCVIRSLGRYAVTFNNYHELKELLAYYSENLDETRKLRTKIRKYAQENLTWEKKFEPKILCMYSKV